MSETIHDLLVIGGGINGCGIARDAAGRGHSVVLCEMNDLGSGTSSWSTKLIHGGLRYLEHYEFRLVREALIERERLWAIAPHVIRPLRFVLPHHQGLRPAWLLRLGLFLYDNLGGRKRLPGTRTLDLRRDVVGAPLTDAFAKGFEYSDCRVDDTRLVVLNAMDAAARGATILTRTRVVSARREDGLWRVLVEGEGGRREIRARVLVNAAGPWVSQVLGDALGATAPAKVRLVKGSHIVVDRLFDHDRAYIFQNTDGRIIFAIPYEDDFTLIGTTDEDYTGDPAKVAISPEEVDYLLAATSAYFARPIAAETIRWTFSGVRPLYDDGASKAQEATRDYVLALDHGAGGGDGASAPLLSIFGGKITTYRRLAEAALAKLAGHVPNGESWTARAPLPGGDFPVDALDALARDISGAYPFLEPKQALRLARTYGTRARSVLGGATRAEDLGRHFGAFLTAREVDYLIEAEWARSAEDILWRRTKLGLHVSAADAAALEEHVRARTARLLAA